MGPAQQSATEPDLNLSDADFAALANLLYFETGIYLPDFKRAMVVSRLSKRLRELRLPDMNTYRRLVEGDQGHDERARMISLLTTNVTHFFREIQHFDDLRAAVLPGLIKAARRGERVRIWSAGCSTGEEAYSLAFTVLDMCPEAATLDFRILGTDIDPEVIATAQQGIYFNKRLKTVPERYLENYFVAAPATAEKREVGNEPRQIIAFRKLNLLQAWPFSGFFDVIMCRNVTIYFEKETQDFLRLRFAERLKSDGRLYVGHSEHRLGTESAFFRPLSSGVFLRTDAIVRPEMIPASAPYSPEVIR
ncbi:CheR family methyltransferase [Chachezhania antarctica]|uniref:CheR family methyltransferase n=1 Tax=Chachezhania antarctica TaxID=2340860 RepID=UPI000EADE476|nr:protein-glutamate O-methyltransferase [Chachezhania antarctica]|tara:strand:+ start:1810 stop:2727 length:918 start_codon:yes stop_codon:yes gene_type:complete